MVDAYEEKAKTLLDSKAQQRKCCDECKIGYNIETVIRPRSASI